jgi:hypothetical protein
MKKENTVLEEDPIVAQTGKDWHDSGVRNNPIAGMLQRKSKVKSLRSYTILIFLAVLALIFLLLSGWKEPVIIGACALTLVIGVPAILLIFKCSLKKIGKIL